MQTSRAGTRQAHSLPRLLSRTHTHALCRTATLAPAPTLGHGRARPAPSGAAARAALRASRKLPCALIAHPSLDHASTSHSTRLPGVPALRARLVCGADVTRRRTRSTRLASRSSTPEAVRSSVRPTRPEPSTDPAHALEPSPAASEPQAALVPHARRLTRAPEAPPCHTPSHRAPLVCRHALHRCVSVCALPHLLRLRVGHDRPRPAVRARDHTRGARLAWARLGGPARRGGRSYPLAPAFEEETWERQLAARQAEPGRELALERLSRLDSKQDPAQVAQVAQVADL
jgi:hypothetical protein